MIDNEQTTNNKGRKPGTPGKLSRWWQRKMNASTANRMRRKGKDKFMGMDMLILHTLGRKSGQPRETPLSWFADGDAKLVVASGGGSQNPDWYVNLMAHPDRAAVELPGKDSQPVTPQVLDGAERERAWQLITEAQPRYAKYQRKSDRPYPLVRLAPR